MREEEERLNPSLQKQRGALQRATDKASGIGRSTSGFVKADIIPRDVLTGKNTGGMEGAERKNEGETSSYGRQLTGLGKTEQDGMDSIRGHWNGSYPTPLGPEIFFWTDRG